MKWSELTPEQKNVLVHTKVMSLSPETPCTDGEYDVYRDCYWQCTCGWIGPIDGDTEHTIPVPSYLTDMNAAWQIVENMVAHMGYEDTSFEWDGPLFKPEHHYLTHEGYPLGTTCWYVRLTHKGRIRMICADTPQDAICKAALIVAGVVLEEEH